MLGSHCSQNCNPLELIMSATPLPILPVALTGLTTREAVIDALDRLLVGLDSKDATLYAAGLADGAIFDLDGMVPKAAAVDLLDTMAPVTTAHTVSNVRVHLREP